MAITLNVENRVAQGKKNRALRSKGLIPVHLYGLNQESLSLQAERLVLLQALKQASLTRPINLVHGDNKHLALVRHIQKHVVTDRVIHVDFIRADENLPIQVEVPIKLINTDEAPVSRGIGILITQVLYNVTLKAKPYEIPDYLEANCIKLEKTSQTVYISELKLPKGVTLVTAANVRIVTVMLQRAARSAQAEETPSS